ncbi:MAG TPA: TIR domain-containing protein [Caulobacterales bacterium]|nr:TIR domain-containing protein [Caulobacterales bacterium]
MEGRGRYAAFVSYRHHPVDRHFAQTLMRELEQFRTPASLRKIGYPPALGTLFRDDDEAGVDGALSEQLRQALHDSEWLIVICSPRTADSRWVAREVEYYASLGRTDRIIPVVIDGDPEMVIPKTALTGRTPTGAPAGWQDDAPLAADLRPSPSEPSKVTHKRAIHRIAAALLQCRYDDLVQRAKEQRRRQVRMSIAIGAGSLLALLAAGGFVWDQFFLVKAKYYANYTEHFGVPEGVRELSGSERARRNITYRISTRGGRPIEMARVNSAGLLRVYADQDYQSESWEAAVADWSYRYDESGALAEVVERNENHVTLRRLNYTFEANKASAVVRFERGLGVAETQSTASATLSAALSSGDSGGHTEIAQHRLTFDPSGRVVRRDFEPLGGNERIATNDGVYGRAYAYTSDGLVAEITNLGADGSPLATPGAAVRTILSYANGQLASVEYRAPDGMLVNSQWGLARVMLTRDAFGNMTREAFFDANARPVLNKTWGYARADYSYDQRGNWIELRHYDQANRLSRRTDGGSAIWRLEYDPQGRRTAWTVFNADDQPTDESHYARVLFEYDAQDRLTAMRFQTADGKPSLSIDDNSKVTSAGQTFKYDSEGRIFERMNLGPDGRPFTNRASGAAGERFVFDQNGRIARTVYLNRAGQPTLTQEGAAELRFTYDRFGNVTSESMYGLQGQLVVGSDQYAILRSQYDNRGNKIELAVFGPDGRPAISKDTRVHRYTFAYDDRGNRTEIAAFGPNGEPVIDSEGKARAETAYDDRNLLVRVRYFGTDGRPIVSTTANAAEIRYAYDGRGNQTAVERYGVDGHLMANPNSGVAVTRREYDDRFRIVASTYFDAAGQPTIDRTTGAHRVVLEYDANDHNTREAYYGLDGAPTPNSRYGATELRMRYDGRGRQISLDALGPDGARVLVPAEIAGIRWAYGETRQITQTTYIGVDGAPTVLGHDVYATKRSRFDADGNEVETLYLDAENRPVNAAVSHGVARIVNAYDADGRQTSLANFDAEGHPVRCDTCFGASGQMTRNALGWVVEHRRFDVNRQPLEGGGALTRYRYDERGNTIEETHWDSAGHLAPFGSDNVATIRHAFDAFNLIVREQYFGADGNPAISERTKVGAVTESYDAFHRLAREEYFGVDGRPMLDPDTGAAAIAYQYDERGRLLSKSLFGVDGRPTPGLARCAQQAYSYDEAGRQSSRCAR